MLERVPPQNIPAELALLGCTVLDMDGAMTAVRILEASDFYRPAHQMMFAAIMAIAGRGVQPDHITIIDELGPQLGTCGGREAVIALGTQVPSSANVEQYARIIKRASVERHVEYLTAKAHSQVGTVPIDEIRDELDKGLLALDGSDKEWSTIDEVLAARTNTPHFKTGLACLDELTGGVRAGMTLLSGKPGSGKSTLCLQIIMRALQCGHKAAILGADQMKSEQAEIMWSNLIGLRVEDLTSEADPEARAAMSAWPLGIYEGRFSLSAICATMRAQARKGVDFFMVDSLQMISVPGSGEEHDKASEAARELKRVAHELSLFLLLTAEYTKPKGKATIENVRGGTGVIHAADQVWWMTPQPPDRSTGKKKIHLAVFKNKMGASDSAEVLTLNGPIHRFTDENDVLGLEGSDPGLGGQFG